MKKIAGLIAAIVMLFACTLGVSAVEGREKTTESRAIAIVFDNSGTMYYNGELAWCRATYAMEVFASMLNEGDKLYIYPMNPIIVGGNEYTMDNPFLLEDASKSAVIRDIYTEDAADTPVESVDCAAKGLKTVDADNKYLIILTDGKTFYENGKELSVSNTISELDERISQYNGKDMTVMYLGIGSEVAMPKTSESEYFIKRKSANSEDTLSTLTFMCNKIFGRDTLPQERIKENTVEFDISLSKLIVFVQGENLSGLSVTDASGNPVGGDGGSTSVKFSENGGCANKNFNVKLDDSLQGMMVTYIDCGSGTYNINYEGTASSIQMYYEPDADLDFVFTDKYDNTVDPNALYEGEYKVSFGMKDAKTGKLISSDLLGNPQYKGKYYINDKPKDIEESGSHGEEFVTLLMNDSFKADLEVTYLSGYKIRKDSSDFGWPELGIKIIPRPAGDLVLEITGGDTDYYLQTLEEGAPYIAKVFYQGTQLTGDDLKSVDLTWEPELSNAEIIESFKDDHYELWVCYKNPDAPAETVCGNCTVFIYADYTAQGSNAAHTQAPLSYNIIDDYEVLGMSVSAPDDYIVISKLEESEEIVIKLTLGGEPLSEEEFARVKFDYSCPDIKYTLTPDPANSRYVAKLHTTEGIGEGDFPIDFNASYSDKLDRVSSVEDKVIITLSTMPLGIKLLIKIGLLLLLILLIILILHIKVLPKYSTIKKAQSKMIFAGDDVTTTTGFDSKIAKNSFSLQTKYGNTKCGIRMEVKPGKDSYLYKSSTRRYAEVKSTSVNKFGNANIQDVTIGSIRYVVNPATNKLERNPKNNDKPFNLKHGMTISYSGTIVNAGIPTPFSMTTKVNFKKK